jgi:hypothetical protein
MSLQSDLAIFFDPRNLDCVEATYNGATIVAGYLDLTYIEPLGGIVQGRAPAFTCAEDSIPGVAHGDSLVVGARSFKVCGVEPDGTGVVVLRLELQ